MNGDASLLSCFTQQSCVGPCNSRSVCLYKVQNTSLQRVLEIFFGVPIPPPSLVSLQMETQTQYQYSSLFTSGLLMATRVAAATPLGVPQPYLTQPLSVPLAGRRDCRLPEPLLVNVPPAGSSPQRKTAHRRRRSSVTLQLSPLGALRSPTKAAEEAWERVKRSSGGPFTASGLRINVDAVEAAQTDGISLLASDANKLGAEIMALAQAAYTQPNVLHKRSVTPFMDSSAIVDGICRNKGIAAPNPKPAPTSPLPEIPTFHVSPPPGVFGTLQADTATVTEGSNMGN
jgi:hypothetical protein